MASFDCAGGTGVGAASFVVAALAAAGYANVYDVAVSAAVCMEPIVVRQHEWACEARLDDGSQRGRERVRVVSVSVGACDDVGRDSCGRWVRAFDVECTVVRGNG